MNLNGEAVLTASTDVALAMLGVALVLCLVRVAKGPSLADRVIALDLISIVSIGIVTTYAIRTDEPSLLDAAIILALISFLGTVTFARYMERTTRR